MKPLRLVRCHAGPRLRFLTDVDEVLCDFQGPALEICADVLKRPLSLHEFKEWDIFSILTPEERAQVFPILEAEGFCSSLEPLPGAIEAIREIRKFADVFAVTSQFHSVTWVTERTKWLQDRFEMQKGDIVYTPTKYLVTGDAFLDDKPDHVTNWEYHHPDGLAMLWDMPNTRTLKHGGVRVYDWNQVITKLEALAAKAA